MVRAEPLTLKYLLESYPGFEAMKVVAELSKDLIAGVDRKPPPSVIRQDAPGVSSNGDTNHENNPDRNPAQNHTIIGNGAPLLPPGGDSVTPRRLGQTNSFWTIDLQHDHLSEGALLRAKHVIEAAVCQDTKYDNP